MRSYDDIVIGAGHNGLTAAAYLARAGRRVLVLERSDHVGGAAISAEVFPGVSARLSRYSYLVSLLPGHVIADLDLDLRLVRRRYSSYTPLPGDPGRGILVDAQDDDVTRSSFREATGSDTDFAAWQRFYESMGDVAQRLFPTMTRPLLSTDAARGLIGDVWTDLVERPLGDWLRREFVDDTVRGIVATDALIGTFADLDDPTLRQNICLLYHLVGNGTGDWDVPVGGMGAVTGALARAALDAGAEIVTGAEVVGVDPGDGAVSWRTVVGGDEARGSSVHAACAPAVLNTMLTEPVATESDPRGAQLKVNLLLTRLPRLADPAVDPVAAFSGTFHVNEGFDQLRTAWRQASARQIPDVPPCEIYCHTLSDRSILGPGTDGMQTLTLFGLHMPPELFDRPGARDDALTATLRSLDSVLAEPVMDVVARDGNGDPCVEVRTPRDLAQSPGLPGGHIFHRSLQWPWAESADEVGTWGVETRHPRLSIAGAGARRGGGVSGIPGHNSARWALQ
ncbi:NAD(P)/FAD-dependent oxidoreductase [uncultured Williamsia sp.]|uniref:phytoene desaturase family protein n=1 Tax=uncultured Williamsia sp. TaxID=259311 RepID=UPI002637A778|nr:NAD(P)/FAD-dependent oxidoreductase [uncultured Williamsia sp.]